MQSHRPYDFWELIQDGLIITIALYVATLPLPYTTEKAQVQPHLPGIDVANAQKRGEESHSLTHPLPPPTEPSCGTFVKPALVLQNHIEC